MPFTLQKENIVIAVLTDLLAFASVFSVRLIRVELHAALPGTDFRTASLFIVTQQDDRGLFVGEVSSKALCCSLFVCEQAVLPVSDVTTIGGMLVAEVGLGFRASP